MERLSALALGSPAAARRRPTGFCGSGDLDRGSGRQVVGDHPGLTEPGSEAPVPIPMRSTSSVHAGAFRIPCRSRLLLLDPAGPVGPLMLHRRDPDPIHCCLGSRERQRRVIARFSQERRTSGCPTSARHCILSNPATGILPQTRRGPVRQVASASRLCGPSFGRANGAGATGYCHPSVVFPSVPAAAAHPQGIGSRSSAHAGELSDA